MTTSELFSQFGTLLVEVIHASFHTYKLQCVVGYCKPTSMRMMLFWWSQIVQAWGKFVYCCIYYTNIAKNAWHGCLLGTYRCCTAFLLVSNCFISPCKLDKQVHIRFRYFVKYHSLSIIFGHEVSLAKISPLKNTCCVRQSTTPLWLWEVQLNLYAPCQVCEQPVSSLGRSFLIDNSLSEDEYLPLRVL